MSIQKRIDSLKPYVIGIRFVDGLSVVDVVFRDGWNVLNSDSVSYQEGENDEGLNYYMFFPQNEDVGLDEIFDFVEKIINHNIEREKKYELLKKKVKELQELFKKTPLSKLERMKFVLPNETLIPDVMPDDNSLDIDPPTEDEVKQEPTEELKKEETPKKEEVVQQPSQTVNKKNQNVELPPKKEKIEVEEFEEPNIVCKCGPDEICPVCEEEKMNV